MCSRAQTLYCGCRGRRGGEKMLLFRMKDVKIQKFKKKAKARSKKEEGRSNREKTTQKKQKKKQLTCLKQYQALQFEQTNRCEILENRVSRITKYTVNVFSIRCNNIDLINRPDQKCHPCHSNFHCIL